MMEARRDPHEGAPKALMLTQHSWGYALLDVASRLCMHYTHDLSQKTRLLVRGCVHPLGDLLDFSCRHGLTGDGIATPCRPWPLDKLLLGFGAKNNKFSRPTILKPKTYAIAMQV